MKPLTPQEKAEALRLLPPPVLAEYEERATRARQRRDDAMRMEGSRNADASRRTAIKRRGRSNGRGLSDADRREIERLNRAINTHKAMAKSARRESAGLLEENERVLRDALRDEKARALVREQKGAGNGLGGVGGRIDVTA